MITRGMPVSGIPLFLLNYPVQAFSGRVTKSNRDEGHVKGSRRRLLF
jgi:hypothetical protein